ncbi:hypothetical protein C8F04DRAFT_1148507 [Mycena alexandri]|uniref:Uncharacterized protein n=1 Tax=Mycena alexandri TaxID=1745969 RepID=A0AAD6WM16_9AGAR|nr:hypothetical protein C8F04DRAFT_1148507 [Mycena alexandri]
MLHDLRIRGYPGLPYELERDIFELTARAHPNCAPGLTLVAGYVQIWVEAVIYETIVLGRNCVSQDLFWRTFSSRPPEFFTKNIRILHLTSGISRTRARDIISVCTKLSSLTCWANPLDGGQEFSRVLSPELRYLSVNASLLWPMSTETIMPDLTLPLFTHITHLEIVNPLPWFDWAPLLDGSLPHLTHVAFGDLYAAHAEGMTSFFRDAFASEDPKLQMLIAVSRDEHFLAALERENIKDPRLICLPSYHHPKSLHDYWDSVARRELQFWDPRDMVVNVVAKD